MTATTSRPGLPAVVDLRDWAEVRAALGVRRKRFYWPAGAPQPIMEVEDISAEMEERTEPMHPEILTARDWRRAEPLYLDTETTGLNSHDQVVEVAVLDDAGKALYETLVKPTIPIPPVATYIHGITDAMVASYPSFVDFWPDLKKILAGRTVIIYNAQFDIRMLRQSAAVHNLGITGEIEAGVDWQCAMLLYADYRGDWDDYHGNNRWWRLEEACQHMRIPRNDVRAHRAAGDAELTRRLIHKLAEQVPWQIPQSQGVRA